MKLFVSVSILRSRIFERGYSHKSFMFSLTFYSRIRRIRRYREPRILTHFFLAQEVAWLHAALTHTEYWNADTPFDRTCESLVSFIHLHRTFVSAKDRLCSNRSLLSILNLPFAFISHILKNRDWKYSTRQLITSYLPDATARRKTLISHSVNCNFIVIHFHPPFASYLSSHLFQKCFPSSSIPVASGQKHARYTLEIARNTRDCENAAAIRIWPPSVRIIKTFR